MGQHLRKFLAAGLATFTLMSVTQIRAQDCDPVEVTEIIPPDGIIDNMFGSSADISGEPLSAKDWIDSLQTYNIARRVEMSSAHSEVNE